MSAFGTKRTLRDVRVESEMRSIAHMSQHGRRPMAGRLCVARRRPQLKRRVQPVHCAAVRRWRHVCSQLNDQSTISPTVSADVIDERLIGGAWHSIRWRQRRVFINKIGLPCAIRAIVIWVFVDGCRTQTGDGIDDVVFRRPGHDQLSRGRSARYGAPIQPIGEINRVLSSKARRQIWRRISKRAVWQAWHQIRTIGTTKKRFVS